MLHFVLPLGLILILQLIGTNEEFFYQTVKEGDNLTLSCENVDTDQNQCEFTDWFKIKDSKYTEMFLKGKKQDGASSSMELLQNCSLVLHSVQLQQAGQLYTCHQNAKEDTRFEMFVASLSQDEKDDKVTLNCSVNADQCVHGVKWFNKREELTNGHGEMQMSHSRSGCWASVSFKDPSPPSQFYQTLICQVEQFYNTQTLTLFPRPPPGEKTVRWKMLVPMAVAGTLALVAAFVALIVWRTRRGRGDKHADIVSPEDGVAYASVQFNQQKTKGHRKNLQSRDGEDDVTYSSVNVPGPLHLSGPKANINTVQSKSLRGEARAVTVVKCCLHFRARAEWTTWRTAV